MHIHTVFFWLKDNTSASQTEFFEKELDKLTRDPQVLHRRIGQPASTRRDVIDNTYDFGISLSFKDLQSHDEYQAGPAHLLFLENCMQMWKKVQVYDMNDILEQ